MARPTKATVDYFPHYVNHGKTIFVIEQLYGNDGYALWFKLLEQLGNSKHHFFDINDIAELEYFCAKCRITKDKAMEIFNKLCELGAIDKEFFSKGIIFSENFVNNIKDAYSKRTNQFMDRNSLFLYLFGSDVVSSDGNPVSSDGNGERKGKENKVEESKPKQIDINCSPEIGKIFALYTENCTNLLRLGFEKRNRQIRELVAEFLKETDYNYDYFIDVCKKANELKQIANNKIDLKSLLNNHIGIMNGKYKQETQIKNKLVFK